MEDNSVLMTAHDIQDLSIYLALYVSLFCFVGCILGRFVLTPIKRYGVTFSQSRSVDGH
ncbi:hypothetical protein ABDK09_02540 [Vibrio sp. CDRSL-10 TSBA]